MVHGLDGYMNVSSPTWYNGIISAGPSTIPVTS